MYLAYIDKENNFALASSSTSDGEVWLSFNLRPDCESGWYNKKHAVGVEGKDNVWHSVTPEQIKAIAEIYPKFKFIVDLKRQ